MAYGLRHALCLSLFLPILIAPDFARAQQDNVDARLGRIENEIQTLSRAVFRGETPPPGVPLPGSGAATAAAIDAQGRLDQIEMDLRALTGQIEQQNFEMRRYSEEMEKSFTALERRVAELEMQMGGTPGATAAPGAPSLTHGVPPVQDAGTQSFGAYPAPGGAAGYAAERGLNTEDYAAYNGAAQNLPQPAQPAQQAIGVVGEDAAMTAEAEMAAAEAKDMQLGTLTRSGETGAFIAPLPENAGPAEYYEQAFALLRDRNYPAAQKSFEAFLDRYPGHNLASNAKYWLGETFYVRAEYERAARIFAESYQEFPKSPKGPDSLLKLGMSLAGMGKKEDACLAYAQLQREYSGGASPVLSRAESEMERLDCQ